MFLKSKIISVLAALVLVTGLTSCQNDSDSSSSGGGTPASSADDWLVLCYFDGDNDLVGSVLNDVANLSYGLSKSSAGTKILMLYDGISTSTAEKTKSAIDGITNPKVKAELANTRLFEMKKAPDGFAKAEDFSNALSAGDGTVSFADVTGQDFTSTCGFISNNEADMSDKALLKSFLDFAETKYFEGSSAFNPKKVILVVSDHGSGPCSTNAESSNSERNVCTDETSGKSTDIGTDQFADAVRASKMNGKLTVIHFDLCLTAHLENAYEIQDLCDYIVASPNLSYGCPWNLLIQNLTKDTSADTLAKSIVAETQLVRSSSFDASKMSTINYADNKYAGSVYNSDLSATYSAFDAKKIQSVYDSLNKVIDVLYAGTDGTYKSKFLTSCQTSGSVNIGQSLDQWLAADTTNNKPHPIDYLFAPDYSYACPRGIHGWAKKVSDTETPGGRMTSMWYTGTYSELLDIGYLMKMFIEDSGLSNYADVEVASGVKASDFINLCKEVQTNLKQAVIASHRCDASKSVPASVDKLSENNFYVELDKDNPTYFGMTISAAAVPDGIEKGIKPSCGLKVSTLKQYSMSYRNSCKFVNQTKWLNVLDAIFTETAGCAVNDTTSNGYTSDGHDPLYSTMTSN